MTKTHVAIESAFRALNTKLSSAKMAGDPLQNYVDECVDVGSEAYRQGRSDLTVILLSQLFDLNISSPQFYHLLAVAYCDEQRMGEACDAIRKATRLAPDEPNIAFAHAQISFENWQAAAKLFRKAQRLDPDNLTITKNAAAALYAEGNAAAAIKILTRATDANPEWIEGHQHIAKYRTLSGQKDKFDLSFRAACKSNSKNLALWHAWFHTLAQAEEWDRARAVLDEAEVVLGKKNVFDIARTFIASESGDDGEALKYFQILEGVQDAGLDLCKVRFFLRNDEINKAEAIANQHIGQESVVSFWPYLSLAWRLMGNDRGNWLDRDGEFIKKYDLQLDDGFLEELASDLRGLHSSKSHYLEQSVRGGTQTNRNLFFNSHSNIQTIRQKIAAAIQSYIKELPQHDSTHPLLSAPRHRILFNGSWSIRLQSQGFHVSHVHPDGWLSSAFYVSLPDASGMGEAPSGWISFGEPPLELKLEMPPIKQVEPKPGRLVLFPSTMWHRTIPFDDGERLTIAFDVGASPY